MGRGAGHLRLCHAGGDFRGAAPEHLRRCRCVPLRRHRRALQRGERPSPRNRRMKSVSGKALCRVLEKNGWTLLRVTGSHHVYGHPGSPTRLSVPDPQHSRILTHRSSRGSRPKKWSKSFRRKVLPRTSVRRKPQDIAPIAYPRGGAACFAGWGARGGGRDLHPGHDSPLRTDSRRGHRAGSGGRAEAEDLGLRAEAECGAGGVKGGGAEPDGREAGPVLPSGRKTDSISAIGSDDEYSQKYSASHQGD